MPCFAKPYFAAHPVHPRSIKRRLEIKSRLRKGPKEGAVFKSLAKRKLGDTCVHSCTWEHSGACVHNIYIYTVCGCMGVSVYLILFICLYIYVSIYIYAYVYMHMCMYINREREQTKVYLQYAFISIYLLAHTQEKNSASGVAFPSFWGLSRVVVRNTERPAGANT